MALLQEVKSHYGRLSPFIAGEWLSGGNREALKDYNPAKDEEIAEVEISDARDAEAAVEAAYRAFQSWKDVPFRDRADYLGKMRAIFAARHEELARILVQDHGRTLGDARGTVQRCIENIESAIGALYSLYKGESVQQLARGIDCSMLWEPVGPFLILTPGNIPMHAWSSFVPYAIGCGCTVIVSPSWQNPVASDAVFKVLAEAGLPPGVMNLIHVGTGFDVNQKILEDKRIAGVGFIGSSMVGKELFALCGKLGKRSSINGNGKNHILVMDDADPAKAADYVMRGCFGMTGQRCLGSDNVLVTGSIYKTFREKLIDISRKFRVGYGLDEATQMGPLTTRQGKEKVEAFIEKGIKEGARISLDGRAVKVPGYEAGYFLGPTILEGVRRQMHIAKEESFGPVCNLIEIKGLEEAIDIINNNTNYGHSACIITASGANARTFIRECSVGNIGVNAGIPQPYAFFPLGSKRDSFFGAAKSRVDSVRLFLDQKTVTERWV
ncbi:MAG: aldehyde dehydrogenase [Deltaproteobacteria bacterium CG_4_8_14_3_um_filter_51_11]|nr:aldehyde dehydrogenase family protein [bacterium]OIP38626.1 MAG: aldehyde dehydrogenase [Desulfobacteraceae bacterium CG2_30_51_40]PIP45384.1 MAG: aldehyde dehydrogenase [Deltaproteobacteria bacterium CG23_combo_of_CG06-09_8_20_14_all_51_20]PIX20555.1 MAG: aldehyde dehydrogenase [Deltaproteobacteria bacterium CG_4_8_14_3_um_filter_51_11]PIY22671.1 MAG: aldehyde dehydrogenase [Deltaproteobacteria bacterium CG_4_10_14_3_um_filter_51_14]PJB36919.1 MAG: aldehyde dehydrogenase [Deltaproteobacter